MNIITTYHLASKDAEFVSLIEQTVNQFNHDRKEGKRSRNITSNIGLDKLSPEKTLVISGILGEEVEELIGILNDFASSITAGNSLHLFSPNLDGLRDISKIQIYPKA